MLDGYLLVFNLVTFVSGLIFSIFSMFLVPALVNARRLDDADATRWQLEVTTWIWLFAGVATAISALALEMLLSNGWLGLTPVGQAAARDVLPWLTLIVGAGVLASWYACQLMSAQRHINSGLEAIPSIGVMIAVLLMSGNNAEPLLWGTLIGYSLQAILLAVVVQRTGMPVLPGQSLGRPLTRGATQSILWLLGSQLVLSFGSVIDQIILAHASQGSISIFSYATRLVGLIITLAVTTFSRGFIPVLATIESDKMAYALTNRWANAALSVGLLCSVIIVVFARFVVESLLERREFTGEDTAAVVSVVVILAFQLPFYLAGVIWWQWLVRVGNRRAMILSGVAGLFTKIAVVLFFNWVAALNPTAVAYSVVAWVTSWFIVVRLFSSRIVERQF
jgi:peptidoglycan biosynthesis protein MviN/MurJ (putative lipid II flippase)